jgi:hypothetical protein
MDTLESVAETAMRSRILPLHLNPADLLWLAQDLPGYPSTFVIQLELSGRFDRPSWESAIDEALGRHPLLRAFVRPAKRGLPCWVAAPTGLPPIEWSVEGAPITCPSGEAIDLAHETGLRIWIRLNVDRARVLFQFHHACCDGTGAYRFIGDVLACYGARTAGIDRSPVLSPVQLHMLRSRSERILDPVPIGLRAGFALAWKILLRRPAPLAAPRATKPKRTTGEFPGFLSRSLDRETTESLRAAAIERGATLNDLLLRDMFLAMHTWNRRQGSTSRNRLRIMMPTDMRTADDCEMPATNLTSYTFLSRDVRSWGSPAELLSGIQAETALIKRCRLGTKFMSSVSWAARRAKLLPFLAARNICLASVVLSNAGDPSRRFTAKFSRQSGRIVAGSLVLETIAGVPPLRAKTRATFSISQYNRRLTVSLRCDPGCFTMADTDALLNIYAEHLLESAAMTQCANRPACG